MADGSSNEMGGGLFDRLKESPRTISALIIIVIVAAAIYAFSGQQSAPSPDEATPATPANEEQGENGTPVAERNGAVQNQKVSVPRVVLTPSDLEQRGSSLPAGTRTESAFVEKAETGNGITHLTRRATTRWLAENQAGYDVTKEHLVYIEDYLQNRVGSEGLSIGEERTISFDMVAEAVRAAGELNDAQLRNLSKYASSLP